MYLQNTTGAILGIPRRSGVFNTWVVRVQSSVLPAGEVEVLVPGEQVAEGLRLEQDLEGVERPALVNVHQAALQDRATVGQVILRQGELGAGALQLVAQPAHLPVDLVDDPVGGLPLPLDIVQLAPGVAHLIFEPLLLPSQPLSLRPDLVQPLAGLLHLGVLGGGGRGETQEQAEDCGARTARQPVCPSPRLTHDAGVFPRSAGSRPDR